VVGLDRSDGALTPETMTRGGPGVAAKPRGGLRRHWLFAGLLLLGAVLRGVVFAAYQPTLIFPDSVRYLQYAHNFAGGHWSVDALRQSGYSVLIIPVLLRHGLWIIPLAQHVVGLATALLVYAVLIRFRTRTWLAAAATIAVLFDPLQLVLEQYVLTDVWTVFLVLAALVILVWRRDAPGEEQRDWIPAAACGLLLGVAVTFRDEVLIMIVPAVLYVLLAVRPRRRLLTRLGALVGCFAIPVAGYLGWFDASHGQLSFTTFSGAFLYGRVADFASCQGLSLPAYERPLCPTQPIAERNADFYTWNPQSPQWTFHPPAGMSRDAVVRDFSLRILRHQPLAYAEAAGRDFGYGFSPVRGAGPEQYSPAYLRFQTSIRPDRQAYASIGALGFPAPTLQPGLAAFLADYGRWCYVPGPVFAAGLVLALASLVIGRLRRRPVSATLLFTASAVCVLIPPAAFATFDWRYQLPQLSLIPVAAMLGVHTIMSRVPPSSQRELRDSGDDVKQNGPALPCGGDRTDGIRSGCRPRAERRPGEREAAGPRDRAKGAGGRSRPLAVRGHLDGRAGAAGAQRDRVPAGAALHRFG
jgi:Dolichyl-phosphate-mannose-protein mannosyltransferase